MDKHIPMYLCVTLKCSVSGFLYAKPLSKLMGGSSLALAGGLPSVCLYVNYRSNVDILFELILH